MKNILNINKTFLENLLLIWQKLMLLSKCKSPRLCYKFSKHNFFSRCSKFPRKYPQNLR